MSNSFATLVLATVVGVFIYYVLDSVYLEIRAYFYGRRYEKFIEDYEDEHWDDKR